eukprot:PITA_27907
MSHRTSSVDSAINIGFVLPHYRYSLFGFHKYSAPMASTFMALDGPSVAYLMMMALILGCSGVSGTTFTLVNKCNQTIWPGILAGNGASLAGGGFALNPNQYTPALDAPVGWSGRFWGRTGCAFDAAGKGSCATGDCGRGLKCDGAGGVPPVTLAEFTIGGNGNKDFYDVSLVDGYNIPLNITAEGGTGDCRAAGCVADLLSSCPTSLSIADNKGRVIACRSACDAFKFPEYCCTGDHNTSATCPPTEYSKVFKAACPTAYSYAYDDASSTFTCSDASYTITFCAQN